MQARNGAASFVDVQYLLAALEEATGPVVGLYGQTSECRFCLIAADVNRYVHFPMWGGR